MLSAPDFQQRQFVFAFLSRGEKISFRNDNIIIKDENGKIRHQSTCHRLFVIFIVGHITITTGLLQRAKKYGFSIQLLTHGLGFYGSWQSKAEGNVILRKKQYTYNKSDIAAHIVYNKVDQQIKTLNKIRKKSPELKTAIKQMKTYQSKINRAQGMELQSLLGIEGVASRVYFSQLFIANNWQGRKPRAKHDITNLLLDIGYTLLFNIIDNMLNLYGFDVYQGVYHQQFYQRKSLVCDLVEPFRPIIDYSIYKAWRLNQINANDFQKVKGQYKIFGKDSQAYVQIMLKAIIEHKQAIFLYVQSYYRAFMRDKDIVDFPVFTGETQ